jgi:hypothetical protein
MTADDEVAALRAANAALQAQNPQARTDLAARGLIAGYLGSAFYGGYNRYRNFISGSHRPTKGGDGNATSRSERCVSDP